MRTLRIKDAVIKEDELFDWCLDHIEGCTAAVVPEKEPGPDDIIQDAVIESITAPKPRRYREKHVYICSPKPAVAKQKEEKPVAEVEPVHHQDEPLDDL